ncbi:MAG: small-conductance mechanosensitive ion channel [Chloroflexota bacterium]|nr:small-conductance mechanosensitive ion channel [Chloroflexota bacterium]
MPDFGTTIGNALSNALNLIVTFLPRVIGFLVIILVGWLIAYLVSRALTFLLRKLRFDNLANRIGLTTFEQRMGVRMDAAGILGAVVFWFLFLIFLVPAADALGLPAVSNVLNTLVAYIPNVFVAILVLFLGALAGTVVADLVRGATASAHVGNPNIFAGIARWAIIGFAGLIALEQLQIAPSLLNILFTALVGGMALAFGLAFGLGGQDAARKWLARGEASASDAAVRISQAQQSNNDLARAEQYRAQQLQAQQMQAEQLRMQQLQAQQTQQGYPQQQQPFTAPDQMNRPTQ